MRGIFALIILLSPLACKHYLVEVDKEADKNQEKGSDYKFWDKSVKHSKLQGPPSSSKINCKVQIKWNVGGKGATNLSVLVFSLRLNVTKQ